MHCPTCGAEVDGSAKYCANCGARVPESDMIRGDPSNQYDEMSRGEPDNAERASESPQDDSQTPSAESDEGTRLPAVPIPQTTSGTGPSHSGAPVSGGQSLAKFACGCLLAPVILVVLIVGGCSLWWSMQPKNVGYDDVLTTGNVNTFVNHHSWGDSLSESGNTEYAQKAIKRLGDSAYGRKFGNLMDSQKAYEEKQEEQRQAQAQASYYKKHPTPTPEPAWKIKADALAQARSCNKGLTDLMDGVVSDARVVAATTDIVDAFSELRAMKAHADESLGAVDNVSCPDAYSKPVNDARVYLQTASDLSDRAMTAVKNNDVEAAADAKDLNSRLTATMLIYATDSFSAYSGMGGNIKDLVTTP